MTLEILYVEGCPHVDGLLERVREVTDVPVTTRLVGSEAEAVARGMSGSPTLLVDGADPFAGSGAAGLSCRIDGVPSVERLRAALAPGRVLSAWRTRAVPLDDAERAAHRAILRAFAATGRPPVAAGVASPAVLRALHEADAIRLGADGEIIVAYPFSATPTPHRVRIADRTDVYAMCAIDALGISAMLGADTVVESVDGSTGAPVRVVTVAGRTTWDPAGAVVFVGADPCGGPSADCCCDYLNFFADRGAAQAWSAAHPAVPGRILGQAEAETLGIELFGSLLSTGMRT